MCLKIYSGALKPWISSSQITLSFLFISILLRIYFIVDLALANYLEFVVVMATVTLASHSPKGSSGVGRLP